MNSEAISERVRQVAAGIFGLSPQEISLEASSETVQNWDSLGHMNLILALEQEFGIRFSPEEIQQMADLTSIVKMLTKLKEIRTLRIT